MARQGCRNHRSVGRSLCFAIVSLSVCFSGGGSFGQVPEPDQLDLRLELTWQSETPQVWAGQLSLTSPSQSAPQAGRLSEPRNLTAGMLLSGGIHLAPAGDTLRFSPPPSSRHLRDRNGRFVTRQTSQGGLGFRVTGSSNDQLSISVSRDDQPTDVAPVTIRLLDLVSGASIQTQSGENGFWSLRRLEGDRLRVALIPKETVTTDFEQPNSKLATSLFWDDQQAQIYIDTDIVDDAPLELVCDTLADGVPVVATQSWPMTANDGQGVIVNATWQPPLGDGSYELQWRLQRKATARSVMGVSFPSHFSESITKPLTLIRGSTDSGVIAESKTTVVVLSRQPQSDAASTQNEPPAAVGRIEPFGASWSVSRILPIRQATQLVSSHSGASGSNELKKAVINEKQVAELKPGGVWQHVLPVAKVGQRHRVVLHLPAGHAMRLGVRVTDQAAPHARPHVIRDVTCIRKRSTTSTARWVTAEIDYFPQSTSPQLSLINRDPLLPAIFEAIDIHIPAVLAPALSPNDPTAALSNEGQRAALMYLDTSQWLELFGNESSAETAHDADGDDVLTAALRLVDSIRQEGYGGVLLTVCEDGRALFPTLSMTADETGSHATPRRFDGKPETLEMLMRLFDRESMIFVPCARPNYPITVLENAIATGPIDSARGVAATSPWSGQTLHLSLSDVDAYPAGLYNPADGTVRQQAAALVRELALLCKSHQCVPSIAVIADEGSFLQLPPPQAMMDAPTLTRFHASLPTGTVSTSQLIGWIHGDGSSSFERWRREQLRELYSQLVTAIDDPAKKLMVLSTSQQPPTDLLDSTPDARLLITRLHRRSYLDSLAAQCHDEFVTGMTASPTDVWKETSLPAAVFVAPESSTSLLDAKLHPGLSTANLDASSYPLLDPIASSLSLAKMLGRGDRLFIALAGSMSTGGDPVRRRSLARFQSLPAVLMDDVPPADEAMKLAKFRRTAQGDVTYFVATNQCRWPLAVHAALSTAVGAKSVLATDLPPNIGADGSWHAILEPGELVAICVPNKTATVRSWSAQLNGGSSQLSEIGRTVRELADAIVAITEPRRCDCIANPGFEEVRLQASAAMPSTGSTVAAAVVPAPTNIADWLMAQHPEGAAALDDQVAHQGKHSIRMRNRDGRPGGTWMVSRPIEPPATGRLAISLMLRGELAKKPDAAKPLIVRVAMEGMVAGSSLRVSKQVEVPRDGQWGQVPCHLEVESLPRCGVESLRLAIDVMSEGTVWIDSITAYDFFMTETEKAQLQSQMFLALGGLAKGELSHAARLLESHWVQYRLGLPIDAPPMPTPTSPETLDSRSVTGDKREAEIARPGIAERLKGWLPRPIRF